MISVYENIDLLSRAAAKVFAEEAVKAVKQKSCFAVLLAGGETPGRTYELLSQEPYLSSIPWDHVHFFWGDERCVPLNDPRNNAFAARRALINKIPISEDQVHLIQSELVPLDAADDYESQLRSFFPENKPVFDLAFLGLGEDGHTASLFPGKTDYPEESWVVVTRKAGEDIDRISLTPAIINMAAKVIFLVSGKNKASVLNDVLNGPFDPLNLPAQLIKPSSGNPIWLVDKAAAGRNCDSE